MDTKKIVLIGGPGTGKTSVLNALVQSGYYCLAEISREVTLEAQRQGIDQLFLKQPLLFSKKLLQGRITQYQKAARSDKELCFIDRGIPDVAAYMRYRNETIPTEFTDADKQYRYDKIFLFPNWEEIYESDNERYESFEEALEIQPFIRSAYEELGYSVIEMPKTTVAQRVDFIVKKIADG